MRCKNFHFIPIKSLIFNLENLSPAHFNPYSWSTKIRMIIITTHTNAIAMPKPHVR